MKIIRYCFILLVVLISKKLIAQHLKPGFDKKEFIEMLKIGARADTSYYVGLPAPQYFKMTYQSPQMGLDNRWQLWVSNDSVAVISVRGTTTTAVSFLANFYAAMVSAKGELQLEKNFTFKYNLSDDPKAAVHVGYLVSTAYLSRDILPKIDSLYKSGIKEFIIAGHSQGGAITYLLTSYLESLKDDNELPRDIRFKTCASASPKPGNLFYAYQFENLTKGGWAYNVVNTADWVPEVPFSIQTLNDFNEVNPFVNAKAVIKKQKFPKNLALRHVYNRLSKPAKRAQKNYEKFLGKMVSKFIKKALPDFKPPEYFKSNYYVRTGTTIVLYADSAYYKKFPQDVNKVWENHSQVRYLFLTERLPEDNQTSAPEGRLNGTWELNYISGRRIAFEGLYPDKKPTIAINVDSSQINGNTSCNVFSGKLNANGNKINFEAPMAMTMMACPGEGEKVFLETLKKITSYSLSDNNNTLTLIVGDVAMMRFVRK
ncbi:MAG: META domain-containing protein [Ginsengibacter sp.]